MSFVMNYISLATAGIEEYLAYLLNPPWSLDDERRAGTSDILQDNRA